MKKAKVVLIIIGIVSIVLGCFGLWYNSQTLFSVLSNPNAFEEEDTPYFYQSFYTMSALCICCYIGLITSGIQFIRLKTNLLILFIGILIFEFLYFFSIGTLWLSPRIGMSIAAATGVANGGLAPQIFTLFPIWASILAIWATRKISKKPTLATEVVPEST